MARLGTNCERVRRLIIPAAAGGILALATPAQTAKMPAYDVGGHCERVSDAVGGSNQIYTRIYGMDASLPTRRFGGREDRE
jgi:hypothetical protein